jgi:pimeloyl-ACP methyl ester carboxylesterase
LAIANPGKVSGVVLLAGSARWVNAQPDPADPDDVALESRVTRVDRFLAPAWFRTVTRETWDDNNFLPGDHAANPVLGLRLWREAARPPLHVWVRYLCEFYAQDITLELERLTTPTLLLHPGLEGTFHEGGNDYLTAYAVRSWGDVTEHPSITAATLPETRIVQWADRPEAVRARIAAFVSGLR